jgi:hypothetical protein
MMVAVIRWADTSGPIPNKGQPTKHRRHQQQRRHVAKHMSHMRAGAVGLDRHNDGLGR